SPLSPLSPLTSADDVSSVPTHTSASASAGHVVTPTTCDGPAVPQVAGFHEVVIECPGPHHRLADLTVTEIARVVKAWQLRVGQLTADRRLKSVVIFRNEGYNAGASLPHCHSQILATDFLPQQTQLRIQRAVAYQQSSGKCLFQDAFEADVGDGRRVVAEDESLVAVCPFAGRVPWQLRLVPKSAATAALSFAEAPLAEIVAVAGLLKRLLSALQTAGGPPDHNLVLQLPPTDRPGLFPWHLDVLPRSSRIAGYELATDVDILTLPPEIAADRLRDSLTYQDADAYHSVTDIVPAGFRWALTESTDL
ncbi:MAG: DUF4921 family protein, partial [Planctomycetaceae bacterium]|nr:DUF4921 family protein [Planctomycetaceae bacterium]